MIILRHKLPLFIIVLMSFSFFSSTAIINRSFLGAEVGDILIYEITSVSKDINQHSILGSHNLLFLNSIDETTELWFTLIEVRNSSLRTTSQLSFHYDNGSIVNVGFGRQSLKELGSLVVYPDWEYLNSSYAQNIPNLNFTHDAGIFSRTFGNVSFEIDDGLVVFSYDEFLNRTQNVVSIKSEGIYREYTYFQDTGVLKNYFQFNYFSVTDDNYPYSYTFNYSLNRLEYIDLASETETTTTNSIVISFNQEAKITNFASLTLLSIIFTIRKLKVKFLER